MSYLFVFIAAVISVFVMFLIAKLIGYRQISEISLFDYINSITLGSIAADLAISPTIDQAVYCLIGMLVFGAFTIFFALISLKSKKARRLLVGEPIILMSGGKLYQNSFLKAKLDLDEFLSMCRVSGYFDPSKLDTVILEPTGKISVIPKAGQKPLTPEDMKLPTPQESICADLIKDGELQNGNLKRQGLDKKWLSDNLKLSGIKNISDVFLATVDNNNKLTVFKYEEKSADNPL